MGKGDPRDTFEFNPVGAHTRNTSLSSVVTLTPPDGATKLLIQAVAQNVRYVLDGSTPSATVGFQMVASDPPIIIPLHKDTNSIKIIQETAGAEVQYQWGGG